jgi:tetratricopeptide (TPR) repeat protein
MTQNADLSFKTDPQTLREIAVNPALMKKALAEFKQQLTQLTGAKKAALLSQMGGYHRCLDDLDESEKCLRESLEIFVSLKRTDAITITKIRLATTLFWKQKWSEAEELFLKSIKEIKASKDEKLTSLLDLAFNSYGKMLFEQKRYKTSLEYFIKALEIRLIKGDIEHINNTQLAIDRLRNLVET